MIKYLSTVLFVVCVAASSHAQKKDTVVLSVYNNNQRFMLYPMPFGKNKPDKHFTAEMVMAFDTLHVLETSTQRDTAGKFPKRWVTKRQCGKLPTNVKDKVVLMDINTTCDLSTQIFNAQEAGALAVILIHTTNRTDSVILPKLTGRERYADENKVKIPCFTVRNVIGAKITAMLPSLVGIRRPDSVGVIQALTQGGLTVSAAQAVLQAQQDSIAKAEYDKHIAAQAFTKIGWELAPNPVHDEAVLVYNFEKSGKFTVEVFNEAGQMVTNYQLPDAKSGKLSMDVTAWQNGIYNVSLSNGGFRQNKRLVVSH
jgi:Secretion system C-terminal sorting domain/PA domain